MPDEDVIFNQVEAIFFELARENLSEEFFPLLELPDAQLICEIDEGFSESWQELIYETPSNKEHVQISMTLEMGEMSRKVSLFLLSLDFENEKECHIQWLW